MRKFVLSLAVAALVIVGAPHTANAATLEDVQTRGVLRCIINTGLIGFAFTDENGDWQGFDVDFCRATAAAVLGDSTKVEFINATGKTRFTLLNSGEGEILYRNTTITMSRDTDLKLTFLGVNYYDGQGFIVPKSIGVSSALELDGASVCIQTGTTTELNLADFFRSNGINYEPVPIETNEEARVSYLAGRCDAYTTDASGLAATRATFDDPNGHVILPEIISKEPLGPAVRQGDDQWADIARWVLNALIEAEEYGITADNAALLAGSSKNPSILRILGEEGSYGEFIGLDNQWARRAIEQVGNYGEIFDRHLGPSTVIGLERGLNAQWVDGGLLYAAPVR
ncbi:MAG: amino acid ABC transporter substrate-binding protein [Alphaproteobacteria bacterium]